MSIRSTMFLIPDDPYCNNIDALYFKTRKWWYQYRLQSVRDTKTLRRSFILDGHVGGHTFITLSRAFLRIVEACTLPSLWKHSLERRGAVPT